jgi:hypothetical protein
LNIVSPSERRHMSAIYPSLFASALHAFASFSLKI